LTILHKFREFIFFWFNWFRINHWSFFLLNLFRKFWFFSFRFFYNSLIIFWNYWEFIRKFIVILLLYRFIISLLCFNVFILKFEILVCTINLSYWFFIRRGIIFQESLTILHKFREFIFFWLSWFRIHHWSLFLLFYCMLLDFFSCRSIYRYNICRIIRWYLLFLFWFKEFQHLIRFGLNFIFFRYMLLINKRNFFIFNRFFLD